MGSNKYDVVVVGASCAGLYAAQLLAERGRRVAVYDRQPQLGEVGRTWIVTDEFTRISESIPTQSIVHQIDTIELISRSRVNQVTLNQPDLIVERALLQPLLAERARAAGVEVHLGSGIQKFRFDAAGVELDVAANGPHSPVRVRAQTLIGADGVRSLVARLMGAPPQQVVPIVQARVRLPAGYDPRRVRVWFDRRRTRFFYWLIPESAEYGVAGLVPEAPGESRQLLDDFLSRQGLQPVSFQGAIIPLHQPARRIDWRRGAVRVLLVGDAAAHVKVTTVGGVVSGLWGAQAAAQSILKRTPYSLELLGLHRELYLHDLIRWLLDRFDDDGYDRLLSALNPSLKQLLSRRNRDSMSLATVALLAAQPALVLLAARAVLSYRPSFFAPAAPEPTEPLTTE